MTTILHKRNSTPGLPPNPASLSAGEIAINITDGNLFTKTTSSTVKTFLNSDYQPYVLNQSLSSINTQRGGNAVTGLFAAALGGYNNEVSGSGTSIINGENNQASGDFAIIGGGFSNTIGLSGDYSAILGGKNNTLNHQESFILGSNISSHQSGFTYVNNLSATGKLYGDASELTGIVAGDTEATTLVRSSSADWDFAYDIATAYQAVSSTFLTSETDSQTLSFNEGTNELSISNGNTVSLSALVDVGGSGVDAGVRALTANWQNTYLNQINYLPLTGGTITGSLSVLGTSILNGITELGSVANATATIYVDTSKVGINTETPNEELTVVGDVSATGKYYGDGSSLTGIVVGDTEATTLVRSNSANWDSAYDIATAYQSISSTFLTSETDSQTLTFDEGTNELSISNGNTVSLSALVDTGGSGVDTEVRALTSEWDSVYTTVQTNSASWGNGGGGSSDIIDLTFKSAYTTYYHELNYNSITTDLSSVQIYEDNTKATHLFEKLLTYTSTALLTGISITDKVNNNTLTKTLSYDGNDNLISTTRIYT